MSDGQHTPVLWVGNTVNRIMIEHPVASHSLGLAAAAERKLWLAHAMDAVLLPAASDPCFADYVSGVTGVRPTILASRGDPLTCVDEIPARQVPGLAEYIREYSPTVHPYALSAPILNFRAANQLSLSGYEGLPDDGLLETISELNSKSGFRTMAENLNLPLVAGKVCKDEITLAKAIEKVLEVSPSSIVKLDRSSNGYGHWIVDRAPSRVIAEACRDYTRRYATQGRRFVVEADVFCVNGNTAAPALPPPHWRLRRPTRLEATPTCPKRGSWRQVFQRSCTR